MSWTRAHRQGQTLSSAESVAVLGATGHVGRVVMAGLAGTFPLTAYGRRPEAAREFASRVLPGAGVSIAALADLAGSEHDVLINCIGIASPADVVATPARAYEVAAFADELVSSYLAHHEETRVVSFSSGAAYCSRFVAPADDANMVELSPDALSREQHYGLAKLASEGRHRAMTGASIIDLRLFGLFSRYADVEAAYLMTDAVRALAAGAELVVTADDVVRDYVSPADLCALLGACIDSAPRNDVFDVYSALPVGKFELLDALARDFGLRYRVESGAGVAATGTKPHYYSLSRRASALGYSPSATSLAAVEEELSVLLSASG